MQEADPATVLGDFDAATHTAFGATSRFFRRGEGFAIETEDASGEPGEFEVAYTFGVEPLQQYLVRFPDGRLQATRLAWDARPPAEGGQRWLHLDEGEPIRPGDVLHWTGPSQRWNAMCADCHSTGVRLGYDPATRRYATTWEEIDVACEACHGAGADHVAWAREGARGPGGPRLAAALRNDARWVLAPGAAIARREGPPRSDEIETCAPCHARRSRIAEPTQPGRPFLDTHLPSLLEEGLYFADGQIQEEVYVWGSFLQSRMHAAGVTCSDCHDPHTLGVGATPDAACASCHRPEAFATPEHHQHAVDSPGASCVACHMPARTYMQVDPRRDHRFGIPRPDLTETLGVPNACSDCHADRSANWAATAVRSWRGGKAPPPHWGPVLHAGRRGLPGSQERLAALARDPKQPGIVRASALATMRRSEGLALAKEVERAASDSDPLVRLAAAAAGDRVPPRERLRALRPLLSDPLRAVRIEAGLALTGVPPPLWSAGVRGGDLADALAEYRAAQHVNADRPEAHVNLGLLHRRLGEFEEARRAYETAIAVGPHFVPALVNLADLHREQDREPEAAALLESALERMPESADLHHALGLSRVRTQRAEDALRHLARAATLAPERPDYAYVHGLALHSAGRSEEALAVLQAAQQRHPGSRELLLLLATLSRDLGRYDRARDFAERLQHLDPESLAAGELLRWLPAEPGP